MKAVVVLATLTLLVAMAEAGCMYKNKWYYIGTSRISGRACECKWDGSMSCMCHINGFDVPSGKHTVNGQSCTCLANGVHGCSSSTMGRYGRYVKKSQEEGCDIEGQRYPVGDHMIADENCKCEVNGDFMCYPEGTEGQGQGQPPKGQGQEKPPKPQEEQERMAKRLMELLKNIN